jgi:hypothetical protein
MRSSIGVAEAIFAETENRRRGNWRGRERSIGVVKQKEKRHEIESRVEKIGESGHE